ncbi:MGH1-like glycoside hydrolase domain-containing protein [Actinocorallia libanotica]|uniref:MGH1-like glycoside hydrolase domain-containing protein n=1 Tax=Actinocorallia libanotica TaxID=46162 RepID=UPI0031E3AE48
MSPRLTGDESTLWRAAIRVLDANWTGTATTPSPGLYPHQWSWDSAFACLGLARCRPERAERELAALLEAQWAGGMIPHTVFNADLVRKGYFPGPELWLSRGRPEAPRSVETSAITQPPLHAFTALRMHAAASDGARSRAFLCWAYPRLVAQHGYLARVRDVGGEGLAAICHPWESGLDNGPAWDRPLAAVQPPPTSYARPSVPRSQPAGVDHERYAWLVTAYRDSGYAEGHLRDEHPFLVEDPLFNTVYLASTHALAEIAALVGADPAPHREAAERIHAALVRRLWDDEQRCFYPRDLRSGRLIRVATIASLVPLLDPELPVPIGRRLADLLLSARFAGAAGYPVPTCDLQASAFDRSAYWRGPTWVNTNWLLWAGARQQGMDSIADLLYGGTLRLIRQSGFREFFDPFDGSGRGSHDYSWTAALLLDLMAARRVVPEACPRET